MNAKGTPENLTPFKPGNNANPEGRNQYTYRREAEQHLEEWCKEHGRDMVRVIADAARAGKPWAAKLILDRVLPAVQQHDVAFPEATEAGTLIARLAGLASRKRANGSGNGAQPKRSNGSGGLDV